MRKFLFALFLLSGYNSFAQTISDSQAIDIGKVQLVEFLADKMDVAFVSPDSSSESYYSQLHFASKSPYRKLPPKIVPKTIFTRFHIFNSTDSSRDIVFFPGFYFTDVTVFTDEGGSLVRQPDKFIHHPDSSGYRVINLAAHDSATMVIRFHSIKTYNSNLKTRLINPVYISSYITDLHNQQHELDLVTFIFSGLLLMMILFSLANYFGSLNREFLYYSGYAFFIAAMLFTKSYYNFHSNTISYFLEAYLDYVLQVVGIGFYMIFMQRFLETKKNYPFLHRLYDFGIIMLLISVTTYTYLHFFTNNFALENLIETITKVMLLGMIVVFIIYSVKRWNDKLLRFLVWGNLLQLIFSMISQGFISMGWRFSQEHTILNAALFYYEFGLFLELVFFLAGLSYKNRKQIIEQTRERERLKMENEFEKQLAVVTAQQEERNRISADMHDELGSGMTHIRLMSELAKNKMKEQTPVEIEKISQSADDVLNKMNAIIWSMNSKNDSLGNLISYIRAYSFEYLEATEVKCRVNIPNYIPEKELSGDKRRNLFLCVKETLNNLLKHSKATEVVIDITTDDDLVITVHDNGIGIDFQRTREFGNGLHNIDRRMRSIGGIFTIRNKNGTESILRLPL